MKAAPADAAWAPRITLEAGAGAPRAALAGRWVAAQLSGKRAWRAAQRTLARVPAAAVWDLRAIEAFDHLGALALWNHWGGQWPAQIETGPEQRALLERVANTPLTLPERPRAGFAGAADALGISVLRWMAALRDFVALIGRLALNLLRLLGAPQHGPWRDFSGHLYRMGARSLGITALVGFLIGVVLAYLMSQVLSQFGAETFIVNILGLALIRELGPLLAAVLIAGRSGSAITAEIGVMRVTEELDAMQVMGIPASFRLVLPRALALALAMPLIAVWTTAAALIGGVLASEFTLGLTPSYFLEELPRVVPAANLLLAVGKSLAFGLFIALIGCHFGLRVQPNTESLGQGTTASVVASITAVILLDALFAVVFKSVGMG